MNLYLLLFAFVSLAMMVGCLTDSPSRERVIMANNHNDGKAHEQGGHYGQIYVIVANSR